LTGSTLAVARQHENKAEKKAEMVKREDRDMLDAPIFRYYTVIVPDNGGTCLSHVYATDYLRSSHPFRASYRTAPR
jgi:hypothetical protein